MREFLNGRETDDFFESLRNAVKSVFGDRLDLPLIRENRQTIITDTKMTEITYANPVHPMRMLSGLVTIDHWALSDSLGKLSTEDIEAEYGDGIVVVDRRNYYFDLYDRDFEGSLCVCKCRPGHDALYEPVEELSLSFIPDNTGENPDAEKLQDDVEIETQKISYEDRERIAGLFFEIGVIF